MSEARAELMDLVDCIPESDVPIVLEVVRRFSVSDIDDDIATSEDIAAHEQAMGEWANGEAVPMDKINWKC